MNCSLLDHLPITHDNDLFERICILGSVYGKSQNSFQSKKYSLKLKVILTPCLLSDFVIWVGEVGTIKNERKFTVLLNQYIDEIAYVWSISYCMFWIATLFSHILDKIRNKSSMFQQLYKRYKWRYGVDLKKTKGSKFNVDQKVSQFVIVIVKRKAAMTSNGNTLNQLPYGTHSK